MANWATAMMAAATTTTAAIINRDDSRAGWCSRSRGLVHGHGHGLGVLHRLRRVVLLLLLLRRLLVLVLRWLLIVLLNWGLMLLHVTVKRDSLMDLWLVVRERLVVG